MSDLPSYASSEKEESRQPRGLFGPAIFGFFTESFINLFVLQPLCKTV